jgi:hypothetical protein
VGLQEVAACAAARVGAPLVACLMKPSRRRALVMLGALPLVPPAAVTGGGGPKEHRKGSRPPPGPCFAPYNLAAPPEMQPAFSALLQKPSDFFMRVENSGEVPNLDSRVSLLEALISASAQQKQGNDNGNTGNAERCIFLDPLCTLRIVMDRIEMCAALDTACAAARRRGVPVRAPIWRPITAWGVDTAADLDSAGLHPPLVLKPRVACGVPEAHQMALIFAPDGLIDPGVPAPGIAQEYIDHDGVIWKVYVAGERAFFVERPSTPNLRAACVGGGNDGGRTPDVVAFDSLASLPTSLPWVQTQSPYRMAGSDAAAAKERSPAASIEPENESDADAVRGSAHPVVPALVNILASVFREQLGLTLFGFDLVWDAAAGELVVLDLNYLPSYKGVEGAGPAVTAAVAARVTAAREDRR